LNRPWWHTDPLGADERGLLLDGCAVAPLARQHGTPLYVYSAESILRRLGEIRAALTENELPSKIFYAMKANRFRPVLDLLRGDGGVGIDACSPREAELARESGFLPEEISVTGSMLSNRDLDAFARLGVHVNLDTRSALERWAATSGSRSVGLRLDPEVSAGWGDSPKVSYGRSKFGVSSEQVGDVFELASSLGLEVDTLHVHVGWGLQESALDTLDSVYARMAALVKAHGRVHTVNVGGGLCARHREEDRPLPVRAWARLLSRHFGPLGVTVACEPGTGLLADAGLLVVEVNTVDVRRGQLWVGVDAGHNLNVYAAHYGIPHAIIHVGNPLGPTRTEVVVAGNINESCDVFARAALLPEVREGDLLALFPAGAYGTSMASDHCMRGRVGEVLVDSARRDP
jgi:diaminopimelate decarboxylase